MLPILAFEEDEAMADYSAEAAASRREYQRKWRAAHRDKVKEYNRTYWQNRAEAEKAKKRSKA